MRPGCAGETCTVDALVSCLFLTGLQGAGMTPEAPCSESSHSLPSSERVSEPDSVGAVSGLQLFGETWWHFCEVLLTEPQSVKLAYWTVVEASVQ